MKAKTTILIGILSALLIGAVTYYFLPSAYYNRTVAQKNRYHFEKIKGLIMKNPIFLQKVIVPENPYFSTKIMVVVKKTAESANDTLCVEKINKLSEDNYLVHIKIPFEGWRNRFEEEVDDYFSRHREEGYALKSLAFLEVEYVKGRGVVSSFISRDFFVYRDLIDEVPIEHRHNRYDANGVELKTAKVNDQTVLRVIKMAHKAVAQF